MIDFRSVLVGSKTYCQNTVSQCDSDAIFCWQKAGNRGPVVARVIPAKSSELIPFIECIYYPSEQTSYTML